MERPNQALQPDRSTRNGTCFEPPLSPAAQQRRWGSLGPLQAFTTTNTNMSKPETTQSQINLLTAHVWATHMKIVAALTVIEKLLPEAKPGFQAQLKLAMIEARNDNFSALNKIDPPAAKLFLELTNPLAE